MKKRGTEKKIHKGREERKIKREGERERQKESGKNENEGDREKDRKRIDFWYKNTIILL